MKIRPLSVYPHHWNCVVPKTPESFSPDRLLPGKELKMYENVVLGGHLTGYMLYTRFCCVKQFCDVRESLL